MTYVAGPHGVTLCKHFEGDPRLTSRRCEGDKFEIGWGSTYDMNGVPIVAGQTCTYEQAEKYRAYCESVEAAPVWRALEFEPNQFQIDALSALAYNIGGGAASGSSAVKLMNAGRWEDAAAAMALWTGATSSGPSEKQRLSGAYDDIIAFDDAAKRWRWVDPKGNYCTYFQRLRGLLRRHLAEGLLSLGLDWREACANDAVFMRTKRFFNEKKGRWEDDIISQTSFRDVLSVARGNKLKPLKPVINANATAGDAVPEALPAPVTQKVVKTPVPATPPEPFQDFDPARAPKPMPLSKRFYGYFLIIAGWMMAGLEGIATFLAQIPVTKELSKLSPLKESNPWMILAILMAGFLLLWYGQVKAKGPTR